MFEVIKYELKDEFGKTEVEIIVIIKTNTRLFCNINPGWLCKATKAFAQNSKSLANFPANC